MTEEELSALTAAQLRTRCDPAQFAFDDTAALAPPAEPFGQARATEALRLGLEVAGSGYHVFVLGQPGSGRHALARQLLRDHASRRPTPVDWCYLYNFAEPNKPRALNLPPGEGARLHHAMEDFSGEVAKAIRAALESDEYRSRIEAIQQEHKQREEGGLQALGRDALAQGVVLIRTPDGFGFAPVRDGEPMRADEAEALPEAERTRIDQAIAHLGQRLQHLLHELPRVRRERQTRVRDATRDAMTLAAGHLVDELKERFAQHPQVLQFLDEVMSDVTVAGQQLHESADDEEEGEPLRGTLSLLRYQVNLLVGHDPRDHAPVIEVDHPTYQNLVGRIDHVAHLGTLLTNFTMIKPGALHRAHGGYLLLDAVQVLSQPYAWDGLKRALKSGRVSIESLPEALGFAGTLPLEPESIPVSVKVVMFGEREHFYLLQELDPEFDALFKIAADFEDAVPRDAVHTLHFAGMLGALARRSGLRPLDREAVARLVEHGARLAEDAAKLDTRIQPLDEVLHEADAYAARAGRAVIGVDQVREALSARERRLDRLRDTLRDEMLRHTLVIATQGARVGQVNGLVVTELGGFQFGHPVRITATVRLGEGTLVDIERESELGGPIHSKGVMILAAFLGARYAPAAPLSLSASLVFEQSYGPVEGDSASLAELCALLSALGDVPIRQSLAVTGAVDQFGDVQAVGGVNDKIEGFFDICRARGLDGQQGVLIPRANVQHLMLREDVVEAAVQGRFHVWAVDDVDDALGLLTGVPAGRPDARGQIAPGSVNHQVAVRLAQLSSARVAEAKPRRPAAGAHRKAHRDGGEH